MENGYKLQAKAISHLGLLQFIQLMVKPGATVAGEVSASHKFIPGLYSSLGTISNAYSQLSVAIC